VRRPTELYALSISIPLKTPVAEGPRIAMSIEKLFSYLMTVLTGNSTYPILKENPPMALDAEFERTKQLTRIVKGYLEELGLDFSPTSHDHAFFDECCEEMALRNWTDQAIAKLRPFLPGGVIMVSTAYKHLSNRSTQMLIALYTAILIYLDDVAKDVIKELKTFVEVFACGGVHYHDVLAAYANILRDFPRHFGDASGIVLSSSLNFINSLVLEDELPHLLSSTSKLSTLFPTFVRSLSGASDAYAAFAFAPSIPWSTYIHALPDMVVFINNGNDVLSLYKEEKSGEESNRVSLLAGCQHVSKLEIVEELALEAVNSDAIVFESLQDPKARDAYENFRRGYIGFHTSLSRYRLHEILGQCVDPVNTTRGRGAWP